MLSWRCEALCNRVQGWWCFKGGKVDVTKKKTKLPKATQKLKGLWSSHFLVKVANIFEMDMEIKVRDLPQSSRSFCVSSCNYLPRWGIWPVGSFGIYRPWKHQAQTLELCHLLASNSEIGICVAPSIEISLDSNTQKSGNRKVKFSIDAVWNFENHLKRTSTFVPGKQARKQAHAICKSIKCSSAAHVEKLRNIKGSVSPQLQFGRSLFVSSCNYLPRWRIWLVESFGIYRPERTGHKLFELRHVFTFNSEIRICVAPSIEISLNSNTQRVETERFILPLGIKLMRYASPSSALAPLTWRN